MKTELQLAMSLMAVVGGMILAPGCIPKEEKKEAAKTTPPPAPPPPEPARSALKITPGGSYTLLAVQSNKCVQFTNNQEGASAVISSCTDADAQRFKLEPVPGNYYKLVNVSSNKCLGVDTASTESGAYVNQYACTGAPTEWVIADSTGGTLALFSRHFVKALDVGEAKTADGTKIIVFPGTGGANQQFKLVPVVAKGAAEASAGSAPGAGGAPGKAKKTKAPAKP